MNNQTATQLVEQFTQATPDQKVSIQVALDDLVVTVFETLQVKAAGAPCPDADPDGWDAYYAEGDNKAGEINNQGAEAQIAFLVEHGEAHAVGRCLQQTGF